MSYWTVPSGSQKEISALFTYSCPTAETHITSNVLQTTLHTKHNYRFAALIVYLTGVRQKNELIYPPWKTTSSLGCPKTLWTPFSGYWWTDCLWSQQQLIRLWWWSRSGISATRWLSPCSHNYETDKYTDLIPKLLGKLCRGPKKKISVKQILRV